MIKRTLPLLFAVAVMFTIAVPAEATHCVRCKFYIDHSVCLWGANAGRTECDDSSGNCVFSGGICSHATAAAATPLASEYQVASVERIDDAPAPDATLIAQLEAPQSPAPAQR